MINDNEDVESLDSLNDSYEYDQAKWITNKEEIIVNFRSLNLPERQNDYLIEMNQFVPIILYNTNNENP